MGLEYHLNPLGATRVTDGHMFKEPNSSLRTANLPSGRSKKWPTLITKVL